MIGIVELVERVERAAALLFVAAFEIDVVTAEEAVAESVSV